MRKYREYIPLVLLLAFYLLCSVRFYPDHPAATLMATGQQLLTLAPFLVGGTLIARSIFRHFTGELLDWTILLRIYLTLGIIVEFFLGLYHYLAINRPG